MRNAWVLGRLAVKRSWPDEGRKQVRCWQWRKLSKSRICSTTIILWIHYEIFSFLRFTDNYVRASRVSERGFCVSCVWAMHGSKSWRPERSWTTTTKPTTLATCSRSPLASSRPIFSHNATSSQASIAKPPLNTTRSTFSPRTPSFAHRRRLATMLWPQSQPSSRALWSTSASKLFVKESCLDEASEWRRPRWPKDPISVWLASATHVYFN